MVMFCGGKYVEFNFYKLQFLCFTTVIWDTDLYGWQVHIVWICQKTTVNQSLHMSLEKPLSLCEIWKIIS